MAVTLVHFPSNRLGLTWCGLPLVAAGLAPKDVAGTDRNALAYTTELSDVTCPGCQSDRPVYPGEPKAHDLTPSEVTLAKILALLVEYDSSSPSDRASRAGRVLENLTNEAFTDTNRALLDRARKAGVL